MDERIPWAMSEISYRLKTLADLTAEERKQVRREIYTHRDTCNRCGRFYDELNPSCGNVLVHERATKEREAK